MATTSSLRRCAMPWHPGRSLSDYDSAMRFFGGDNELGRAWADGFEQRADGLWPRWDLDVMMRTMEPVFAREYWPEWESLPQPTLLVLGQTGSIDPNRVDRMLAGAPGHETRNDRARRARRPSGTARAWLQALDEFLR